MQAQHQPGPCRAARTRGLDSYSASDSGIGVAHPGPPHPQANGKLAGRVGGTCAVASQLRMLSTLTIGGSAPSRRQECARDRAFGQGSGIEIRPHHR
jgi:hypothetical protein